MKRFLLLLVVVLVAGFVVWKIFLKKEEVHDDVKEKPLELGKNSDAFTTSFSKLLNDYFSLRDALVDWDSTKANQAAATLKNTSDSLPVHSLKGDSIVIQTADNLNASIGNELKGFIGETTIQEKRHAFNALSDEIYNLVRTVRYDGGIIYHIKCPMAFGENTEGFWLSKEDKIINPYLGNKDPKYTNKMLGCGEIVDSLNFVKN